MSLIADKRVARERARSARRAAHGTVGPGWAEAVWGHLREALPDASPGMVVSGYWAMRDEADIGPILERLHAEGFVCALPAVEGRDRPLTFRRWRPGDRLVAASFGTHEPAKSEPRVTPEILLVPLLAFDRAGRRLGYGGGYYDRTLRKLRSDGAATAVGVAFAAQEVPSVPAGPGDEKLDWIVTERGAFRAKPL